MEISVMNLVLLQLFINPDAETFSIAVFISY